MLLYMLLDVDKTLKTDSAADLMMHIHVSKRSFLKVRQSYR